MVPFNFVVLRSPAESLNNAFRIPYAFPPIFAEGLYLASHDLYKQLKKLDRLNEEERIKVKASLLKYWLRASIRCTPFGAFAGSSVIPITENNTEIIFKDAKHHDRQVRLDMSYIYFLICEIEKLPIIQSQIHLFPNNSIYYTARDVRYTESFIVNFYKDYKLTAVEKSDYLLFVIEKAMDGISIDRLSSLLSDFANVTHDDAKKFIMEMWSSQLLISELEPCVTGIEPFEKLISTIDKYEGVDLLKDQLIQVFNRLKNPEEGADYYIEIEARIKQLFSPPQNFNNFIQTDLFLSCQKKEINKRLIESVVNQVEDLMSLSNTKNNTELYSFRKKFSEKYEKKTIPLAIALDSDLGIGYAGAYDDISGGNPLIDDIGYYVTTDAKHNATANLNDYTFNKYLDYLNGDKDHIEISETELKNFKENVKKLQFPTSLSIMGSLMKKEDKLDNDNFIFSLKSIGGPSGGNLLGRFTQGNDDLLSRAKEILNVEEQENPEIIFAEIVHIPQSRLGNVLLRPILRNYEIPYVGKSGIQLENQISITDLYLCVRNEEIVLLSKKHNKRVIPRLTTAHNFNSESLPIYKFLCDLQHQNLSSGAIWDWGSLNQLKNLPRVVYKNIILKRARWKVELSDISELPSSSEKYSEFFAEFISIKTIPSKVLLTELDNQILIDFGVQESIMIFLSYLKKNKSVLLEEFLFTNENCISQDRNGQPYTNEIVIPVHNSVNNNQTIVNYRFPEEILDKKYYPGSEWLFLKVFCSAKTADKLLTEYLLPFIETGRKKKLFDQFFFLRYNENGSNLRIRFYNKNTTKQNNVLAKFMNLFSPLLESNLVERIALDTYVQETERYGGYNLIAGAEALFDTDSLATLRILNLLDSSIENNYRILFAMKSIDVLMDDFKLSLFDKKELLKEISNQFFNEFGASPALQKNINTKFKNLRRVIFSHMDPLQDSNNDMIEITKIFKCRSLENEEIIDRFFVNLPTQQGNVLNNLLPSYFHMSINRLFISQQRKYELLIYHFLERYYTSIISMAK